MLTPNNGPVDKGGHMGSDRVAQPNPEGPKLVKFSASDPLSSLVAFSNHLAFLPELRGVAPDVARALSEVQLSEALPDIVQNIREFAINQLKLSPSNTPAFITGESLGISADDEQLKRFAQLTGCAVSHVQNSSANLPNYAGLLPALSGVAGALKHIADGHACGELMGAFLQGLTYRHGEITRHMKAELLTASGGITRQKAIAILSEAPPSNLQIGEAALPSIWTKTTETPPKGLIPDGPIRNHERNLITLGAPPPRVPSNPTPSTANEIKRNLGSEGLRKLTCLILEKEANWFERGILKLHEKISGGSPWKTSKFLPFTLVSGGAVVASLTFGTISGVSSGHYFAIAALAPTLSGLLFGGPYEVLLADKAKSVRIDLKTDPKCLRSAYKKFRNQLE